MAYHLSAAKLQTYQRCPQAYYFRYERGMFAKSFFGSTDLGSALHKALAQIYWDWHYQDPIPDMNWIDFCWEQQVKDLSTAQVEEGKGILRAYYERFIANQSAIHKPLAVEGKIQGSLQAENLEFTLTGRYDRLDWLDDGLELIDYKSTKEVKTLDPADIDLQIGLYYLALDQKYHQSLLRLSLIYLRTGETVSFDATSEHKQLVHKTLKNIATRLRQDREWEPVTGKQCDRCSYSRYCPGIHSEPEPLPSDAKAERELQLVLGL